MTIPLTRRSMLAFIDSAIRRGHPLSRELAERREQIESMTEAQLATDRITRDLEDWLGVAFIPEPTQQ